MAVDELPPVLGSRESLAEALLVRRHLRRETRLEEDVEKPRAEVEFPLRPLQPLPVDLGRERGRRRGRVPVAEVDLQPAPRRDALELRDHRRRVRRVSR